MGSGGVFAALVGEVVGFQLSPKNSPLGCFSLRYPVMQFETPLAIVWYGLYLASGLVLCGFVRFKFGTRFASKIGLMRRDGVEALRRRSATWQPSLSCCVRRWCDSFTP